LINICDFLSPSLPFAARGNLPENAKKKGIFPYLLDFCSFVNFAPFCLWDWVGCPPLLLLSFLAWCDVFISCLSVPFSMIIVGIGGNSAASIVILGISTGSRLSSDSNLFLS
jgi:hypothetical protein